ncbi:MAG: hypothetical protein ACUVRL_09995 [Candidatus Saccharicenans sp.]
MYAEGAKSKKLNSTCFLSYLAEDDDLKRQVVSEPKMGQMMRPRGSQVNQVPNSPERKKLAERKRGRNDTGFRGRKQGLIEIISSERALDI